MDSSVLLIVFLAFATVVLLMLGGQKLVTQKRERLNERVAVVAVKDQAAVAEMKSQKASWMNLSGLLSRIAGPDFMR